MNLLASDYVKKERKVIKEDSCMKKMIKIRSYEQCYFQQNLGRK